MAGIGVPEYSTFHGEQLNDHVQLHANRQETGGYLINIGKKGKLEWKRFIVDDLHVRTR